MEDTTKPSERMTMADVLQAEVDLMNEKQDGARHPVCRRSDDLAAALQHAASGYDQTDVSGLYDEDVIQSYHNLTNMNAVLENCSQFERCQIAALQCALEEHQEIHLLLVRLQQKQGAGPATEAATERDDRNPPSPICPKLRLRDENAQLKDDLAYVTNCIERQRQDNTSSTLNALLRTLISQRLDFPDDPYVDLSTEHTKSRDLQILRDAQIIATYKNTELVCLIDYSAT